MILKDSIQPKPFHDSRTILLQLRDGGKKEIQRHGTEHFFIGLILYFLLYKNSEFVQQNQDNYRTFCV